MITLLWISVNLHADHFLHEVMINCQPADWHQLEMTREPPITESLVTLSVYLK